MCSSVLGAEGLEQTGSLSLRSLLLILWEKFYQISLNPDLCGLFFKGHCCSFDGVDRKVISFLRASLYQASAHSILTPFCKETAIIIPVLYTVKLWHGKLKYLHHDGERQTQEVHPGLWICRAHALNAEAAERLVCKCCTSILDFASATPALCKHPLHTLASCSYWSPLSGFLPSRFYPRFMSSCHPCIAFCFSLFRSLIKYPFLTEVSFGPLVSNHPPRLPSWIFSSILFS